MCNFEQNLQKISMVTINWAIIYYTQILSLAIFWLFIRRF